MPYNNQQSNTTTNTTTNSISMFDPNGTLMKIAFYDDSLSLGIWIPKLENEKRTYPKELRESTILTKDRVSALYNLIVEKLLPAYKEGGNYNGGVFTNNNKTNVVECATIAGELYLNYYKEIDDNRKPKYTYTFHFPKTPVIEGYSATTENDFKMYDTDASFLLFVKILEAFMLTAVSGASAHSDRFTNRYFNDKKMDYLYALAGKLGVTVNSDSNPYPRKQNNSFDGIQNSVEPEVKTTQDLNGILT